jgi:hypothetical protein
VLGKRIEWNINATFFEVSRNVLPEIRELQGGTSVVGEFLPRFVSIATEVKNEPADRIRRVNAIVDQGIPVRIAVHRLVLAEGTQQIGEGLGRNILCADSFAQGDQDGMSRPAIALKNRSQLFFPSVEQCQRTGGIGYFVAQVVRPPAVGVNIVEILVQATGQQAGDNIEILIVMGSQPAGVALCLGGAAALRGKIARNLQFRCG